MLAYPQFNPIAFSVGPVAVRWYGLMYLAGFAAFLGLTHMRAKNLKGWDARMLDDLLFYGVLGVVLGGRLGYALFYNAGYFLSNPTEIFAVWHGGMSFHGGFLGVLFAVWFFCRKTGKPWLAVMDFVAPAVPLGLAAGRLGNFINGELVGRVTDVPWGMVFPQVDSLPRHPSQLYECALEGLLLFAVLWIYSAKPRPVGAVSAMFLFGYGVVRFLVEFTRQPDDFLGLLSLGLSMGQWLSLPMIAAGIALFAWAQRKN